MSDPLLATLDLDPATVVAVIDMLRARGQTVGTAESLTAGLVAAALTSVPGSSAVVRGGLVVYATDLKVGMAGVSEALLAEHGAVHPEVARQLAAGARRVCDANWGVGLTGVAGPDPQDAVSPGRVYLAVHGPDHRMDYRLDATGGRHQVRAAAVVAAVNALHAGLIG